MVERSAIQVDGLKELLRAMSVAPRELSKEIRVASKGIAEEVAEGGRQRARQGPPQLAAVADTIRAVLDRIPVVKAGGAKRVTSSGAAASDLLFGADFGAYRRNHPQFPRTPPVEGGRTIYPELWSREDDIADDYLDAVERVFMANSAAAGVDAIQALLRGG